MKNRMGSNEAVAKARGGGSREAIVEAAERLFLERGFGSVSMDELADAAGLARRTLYNQFSSKEEIFREMLLRVSGQLERAFPPGIETQGDVEEVLRLIAQMILKLHENPGYLGFLRMVVADARQFPWIAEEFSLGPWMTGRGRIPTSDDHIVEETVRMFLHHYGHARSKKHGRAVQRGA